MISFPGRFLALAVVLCGGFALLVANIAATYFGFLYPADMVHAFLVAGDVVQNPQALFTWHHSPALYVFPDWFLAEAANLTGAPAWVRPVLYGTALFVGYSLLGGTVAALARGGGFVARTLLVAAMLGGFGLLALWERDTLGGGMIANLAAAYIHTGDTLSLLAATALLLAIRQNPSRTWLALLGAVCALATFSDPLFIAWFSAPALILLVIERAVARRGQRALFVTILVATGAAYGIERAINPTRNAYLANKDTIRDSLAAFWNSFGPMLGQGSVIAPMLLALIVAAVLTAAWALVVSVRRSAFTPLQRFHILTGGMLAGLFATPIVMTVFLVPEHWRYFMAVPVIVIVWLATVLPMESYRGPRLVSALAGAGFVLVAMGSAYALYRKPFDPWAHNPLTQCILDAGLRVGIGDYWTAKREIFLSDRRIVMVQVGADGAPWAWNYNTAWYDMARERGGPTFIVPARLDEAALRERYGAPARVLQCPSDKPVWIYDAPLAF